ncbi:unnamed protein product [Heterosigma akashiwo]|uniref:5'-nucleotidase n=2 Tax=Heterosigma akashiwo TaxID=2829 RepID=A0A6V1LFZ6_HETAK|mmetsp:Transcript_1477/g.2605  ORF Transcript_1477/g.2605 Transcript_1477/m.2605 type:complete len:167 (+) Transcript_1477:192-692(+)
MARTQIPVTVLSDGYTNIIAEILKAQAPQICDQYERRLPQDLVIFANSIRLDDYAGFYPSGFEGAPVSEKNLSLGEMNKVRPGLVKTQRPNLLVLGSSPEGWDLAPGFETGIILSVGFMEWTKEAASDLNKCASNYDVVIFHAKGDASFEYVLDLLGGIFPGYFSQ